MSSYDRARIALFVASSDNTRDVFERVFPSLQRYWPDCPYSIYAGFNRVYESPQGFRPIYAPVSDWGIELAVQLRQLAADYVILFLDDFLLSSEVDSARVEKLISVALCRDYVYLRLTPVRRPLLPRLLQLARKDGAIEAVPANDPYYSSLQVALWKKAHLLQCLEQTRNIWNFERARPRGAVHFASRTDRPIRYRHIVEKGRWLPDARRRLREAGTASDLGRRAVWPLSYQIRRWVGLACFELVGYSVMRFKEMRVSGIVAGSPDDYL